VSDEGTEGTAEQEVPPRVPTLFPALRAAARTFSSGAAAVGAGALALAGSIAVEPGLGSSRAEEAGRVLCWIGGVAAAATCGGASWEKRQLAPSRQKP
jgi:hypothetical protein